MMRNPHAIKELDGDILPPIVLPETIGPYRIEERLGGGGMGEVYRAYDDRLERRVAVKVIRPEAGDSATARERFRREARAAAGLAHPGVVQIFDIVERPEGDCIVMELVEGETLRRHLRRGRPSLAEAVRIAREVAEGLAAAHAKGLVHRDLKTENVMITSDGRAKILDFGLAKRTDPEAEDLTVSVQGHVVGTSHAMSPEQAQGQPVDHRSDLFSFGSLLYELLTGEAPFRRDSLAQTLTWVCTRHPDPAHEVAPEVPEALSALADHLMEKDPADRPQSAGAVAAVLAHLEREVEGADEGSMRSASVHMVEALREPSDATRLDLPRPAYGGRPSARSSPSWRSTGTGTGTGAAGADQLGDAAGVGTRRRMVLVAAGVLLAVLAVAGGTFFARSATGAVYVAVPAPAVSVEGDVPGGELLPSAVRVALLQELLSLEGITALAPDQVDAAGGTSMELARALAADEVVTARLACEATRCWATLERVRGEDGSLIWTQNFEVETGDLLRLSNQVGGHIRRAYGSREVRDATAEGLRAASEETYEEFLRIREAYRTRRDDSSLRNLLARTERILRESPQFLPAYLQKAEIALARFHAESRSEEDLETAFAAIEEARRLAPTDPEPLFKLVDTAVAAGQLALAEDALENLEEIGADSSRLQAHRARVLEHRGRPDEALDLMRKAAAGRPSESNLLRLAYMELNQGETEAARRHIDEALERAPDSYAARNLLAQLELMSGSVERAVELYQELLRQSPESVSLLSNLGLALLLDRRYQDAAEVYRQVVDRVPDNPLLVLNRADAEALSGNRAEAAELYRHVLDLTVDARASDWQMLTVRAQALAHLDRDSEAIALVQRALGLSPEHSQTAFEAASVYSIVGDRRSALVNAERALELGVEPRWFRFPWFDDLREEEEFRRLLRTGPEDAGVATPSAAR